MFQARHKTQPQAYPSPEQDLDPHGNATQRHPRTQPFAYPRSLPEDPSESFSRVEYCRCSISDESARADDQQHDAKERLEIEQSCTHPVVVVPRCTNHACLRQSSRPLPRSPPNLSFLPSVPLDAPLIACFPTRLSTRSFELRRQSSRSNWSFERRFGPLNPGKGIHREPGRSKQDHIGGRRGDVKVGKEVCKWDDRMQDRAVQPHTVGTYCNVEVSSHEDGPCANPKRAASFPLRLYTVHTSPTLC